MAAWCMNSRVRVRASVLKGITKVRMRALFAI